MNELKIFSNEEFGQVRMLIVNGEPWFVGKDVAEILGYSNSSKVVINHVDEEDKIKQMIAHSQNGNVIKTQTTLINESGLYSLVLGSKLPSAKKFKHWVTSDVLPSIRKHGMYATDELINNPDLLIQVATALKEEREKNVKLETEVKVKDQLIGELKPKADYVDTILQSKELVNITPIAKDYGMSGKAMNELLHTLKVQYNQGGQWLLYSKYQGMGYTHSETFDIKHKDGTLGVRMRTKWTQKGRLFLYEILKSNGFLPVIEQEKTA